MGNELYNAVMRQKIDKVREILNENEDPSLVNEVNVNRRNQTPIFAGIYFASRFGQPGLDEEILDLLIENGANLLIPDKYGMNILHLAATE